MATRYKFKQSIEERRRRTFSEEFKKQKVREIERKAVTVAQVSREYEVRESNVGKWVKQYGSQQSTGVRTIVECESDTRKLMEMKAKVAELERLVGQKQIQLEFKDKMIELAEEAYGVDIKKKFGGTPSSGTGSTGNPSTTA